MFRKKLLSDLEQIFGFRKTTFLKDSDDFEQDTLFVELDRSNSKISNQTGGQQIARVVGSLVVYSQDDRLPYGFFSKRLELYPALAKNFFFGVVDEDVPESPARMQNIHERRCDFIYFYNSQFDPNKGELNALTLE